MVSDQDTLAVWTDGNWLQDLRMASRALYERLGVN